jgi:energy-coupling factor transporter ATP-binding protein EcfA2
VPALQFSRYTQAPCFVTDLNQPGVPGAVLLTYRAVTDFDIAPRTIDITMIHFVEQIIAAIWNRFRKRRDRAREERGGFNLGFRVVDGQVTRRPVALSNTRRTMHLALLGKTGSGKSSLLRHLASQDIAAGRGFVYFDLHGDAKQFLLGTIRTQEQRLGRHLNEKLIVIDPADPLVSVGFNPLEQETADFLRITEFTQVLRQRWALDHFGARTDELLRNALYVLSANSLTLLELAPLLTNTGLRAACLEHIPNPEVRDYFESRYDQLSEAMQATMREPILNKTSAFTADPHFRHIVGQARSTFSITEAMDQGRWVIVNLEKGKLGEQALTLGSLIFTVIKNALFARTKRSLFTLYCDEIQNLVAYGSGIETILSEARKFGVGVVSANQFLDQYPVEMRAAILSIATHAFFQLSSADAGQIAQALDGGKPLAERLKNLSQRHFIVKSVDERWAEVCVPTVHEPTVDYTDLLNRSRFHWGRVRTHIERDIQKRQRGGRRNEKEALDAWE